MVKGLSWGEVVGYYSKIENGAEGAWHKLPNIVEGTLAINTEKGDKMEAKIEGGRNEYVQYKKSTFSVEWEHRYALEDNGLRQKPIEDIDGVVDGVYAFKFIPTSAGTAGFYVKRAAVSVEDTYSSENGINWKYTAEALAPENESEKSIAYGHFTDPTASGSESESEEEAQGGEA